MTAAAGADIAAQWLAALVESGGVEDVRRALDVQPTTQVDAWIVLAAAEVVAAAAGQPALELPEALRAWVEWNAPECAQLIDLARGAVAQAPRAGSPLLELWSVEEAGDFGAWTMRLADLERRLGVP
jgi:hypothetical protein